MMPDSRIDILVNLNASEAKQKVDQLIQSFRGLKEEQNRLSAASISNVPYRDEKGRFASPSQARIALTLREIELTEQLTAAQLRLAEAEQKVEAQSRISGRASAAASFTHEPLETARKTLPNYTALAEKEATAATEAEQAKQTAAVEREATKRSQIADREVAKQQAALQRQTALQEQAAQKESLAAEKEYVRARQVKLREIETVGNATIKGAAEREKTEQIVYQQAIQDNKDFERQMYRGVYTAQPNETVFADIRGLPTYRQLQAAEGERQAAVSMQAARSGGGGFMSRFSGINRQGSLEAQAAIVNTVQAMASGMNPLHVLMMESTQLAGSAIQGGLISLKEIWTAMISPIGQVAAGIAVVVGSLALLAYRGYQASEAIKSIQSNYRTIGLGQESFASYGAISTQRSKLSKEFDFLGTSDLNDITTAFSNSSPAVAKYSGELSRLAVGYSAVARVDPSASAEMFKKAAEGGAGSLLKLSERLNVNGSYWREHIQSLIGAGKEEEAVKEITDELMKSFGAGVDATHTIDSMATSWKRFKDSLNEGPGAFWNYLTTGHGPVDVSQLRPALPESTQRQQRAIVEVTPELKQREDIQTRYNELLEAEKRLHLEINIARSPVGEPSKVPALENELSRQQQAIANFRTIRTPVSAKDQEEHQVKMQQLQSEMTALEYAAQHDETKRGQVLAKAKEIADEITAYENKSIDERISGANRETAGKIQAREQEAQKIRAIAQANLNAQMQASALQRAQTGPQDISGQRVAAERELATLRQNEGGSTDAIAQKEIEIVNLKRQERLETENVVIAQLQQAEAVAQMKGDLGEVVRLQQQQANIISQSKDRSALEQINAQTRAIQQQQQAIQTATQNQIQAAHILNQMDAARLQTGRLMLQYRVSQMDMTREEAIRSELEITQKTFAQQEARIQNQLNNSNLQLQDRVQLNEELASLYEQDAQKQIELNIQLTEAIKQENERRIQYARNFFESVGTGFQDFLSAGLNKTSTLKQALTSLRQSLTTSFVKEATNMGSMFAGKALASTLGVKVEEGNTGISNVLATALGQWTGLTKPLPKLNEGEVMSKMDMAAQAHQKAAGMLQSAASAIMQSLGGAKGGSSPGIETAQQRTQGLVNKTVSGSASAFEGQYSQDTASAASLVKKYESKGNYNIGVGGTDLSSASRDENGFPIWAGVQTPKGITHAAGAYQFQPGTWATYAKPLGIKDFSPESQDKVFAAAYAKEGFAPWAPYNSNIAAQLRSGNINKQVASIPENLVYTSQEVPQIAIPKTSDVFDEEFLKTMREYDPNYDPYKQHMPRIEDIGGPTGPKGYDYIFGKNIPRPEVDAQGNITRYGDGTPVEPSPISRINYPILAGMPNSPNSSYFLNNQPQLDNQEVKINSSEVTQSVAQGVIQGQQQATTSTQSAIQQGITQAQQTNIVATQQDTQQTQTNTQSTSELSSSVKELNSTIQSKGLNGTAISNKEMMAAKPEGAATQETSSELSGVKSAASSAGKGLDLFASAAGLASSAALLFGKNLSPTGKAIIGGVGVASSVLSIGSKIGSLFAAPATGGLSLLGGLFEKGGIVPSAAGGMVVPGTHGGMPIIAHPREMVLPANLSDGFRNIIENGQGNTSNETNTNTTANLSYRPTYNGHHPYKSRNDISNLMRRHGGEMMRWAETYFRNGLSPIR